MTDDLEHGAFAGDSPLAQRFFDSGMLWLANRALHPFGWALGVSSAGGKVTGLTLTLTSDPEGFLVPPEAEIEARRRFLKIGPVAEVPAPAASVDDLFVPIPPGNCPDCDRKMWQAGDAQGCGNPRCRSYTAMPRREDGVPWTQAESADADPTV